MKIYRRPKKETWKELIQRPTFKKENLDDIVDSIIQTVRKEGDQALLEYTKRFDQAALDTLLVSREEIEIACTNTPLPLQKAIQTARQNIQRFHEVQKTESQTVETMKGVTCWRKNVAIEKVGLYIPGGTAPLFSTILMLGIPAQLAGCNEVILCTPPDKNGKINPAILYTAQLVGIHKIFKVGGAQAIAAMAYGTESVPQVYKIFGPGNQFVTKAKERVQQNGVAIDMPAGPSEVLIIADETANPVFVAADLLAQAEHGTDSQVVLLTTNEEVNEKIREQIDVQLTQLPRKEIACKALENSFSVIFRDIKTCMAFSNAYAPEHLIIAAEKAENYTELINNAGSVFLGNYTCESAGDYASGTNHTLPTNGYARNYSGVSLDSFYKKITFQKITREGIQNIGKTIEIMAEAEDLFAHKNAVTLRLKSLK